MVSARALGEVKTRVSALTHCGLGRCRAGQHVLLYMVFGSGAGAAAAGPYVTAPGRDVRLDPVKGSRETVRQVRISDAKRDRLRTQNSAEGVEVKDGEVNVA